LKKLSVAILGATGFVGQRFVQILENHPWFNIDILAASNKSCGKTYEEALNGRWNIDTPIPENLRSKIVLDSVSDAEKIAQSCDFVFSAINMSKSETKELEYKYAKLECPVISNNSAHRETPHVPIIIPEINANHTDIIPIQKKKLGTKFGFIAVKPNCSIQCFLPALHALKDFLINSVVVCTYQAISGAGKTFNSFPEIIDNIIPFIENEEQKTETEPLKIWGNVSPGGIVLANRPKISAHCSRVPVSDGHMASVFANFKTKIELEDVIRRWQNFNPLRLPSSPKKIITFFEDQDRPQTKLERNIYNGMSISVGRLRKCSIFDIKFVCVSHNTIRGAAGGSVLLAELLYTSGYLTKNNF
jgi:aspartate-semialdehyde dehydrogenase